MTNASRRQRQRSRNALEKPWKRWTLAVIGTVILVSLLASGTVVAIFFLLPSNVLQVDDGGVVQALEDGETCTSGRIFFGSVSDAFPTLKNKTGIFVKQPHRTGYVRPFFKHEARDVYLTFTSYGYWVVGDGHVRVDMRALSAAMSPDRVESSWSIRVNRTWFDHGRLEAKCVPDTFVTCRSGRLRMTGISRRAGTHTRLMGNYSITKRRHNERPVYRHDALRNEYLFFSGEFWSVNNELNASTLALFCFDNAIRPEYIVQPCVFASRFGSMITEHNITIRCLDHHPPAPSVKSTRNADSNRCNSSRLFFGSVKHEFKQHDDYTGVFLLEETKGLYGQDLYKHESVNIYIQRDKNDYWVVGDLRMSEQTTRIRNIRPGADLQNAMWSLRVGHSDSWRPAELLTARCVEETLRTCKGDKVTLSGVTDQMQQTLNGRYSLTDGEINNRPIYRHDVRKAYLYHNGDWWMVNDQLSAGLVLMYSNDLASRAEYIVHPWLVWTGQGFIDQQIQVNCVMEAAKTTVRPDAAANDGGPAWVPVPKCTVPFHYEGRQYSECINASSKIPWCSHSRNYKGDWSYCKPRMMLHPKCTVPFHYNGRDYTGCTQHGYSAAWCSLTAKFTDRWELCNPSTILPHADCHFPFTFNGLEYSACTTVRFHHHWCATKAEFSHDDWVTCINTGLLPHAQCVFPFTLNGRSYSYCVVSRKGNAWCSTTSAYSGNWQYCKPL